MKDGSVQSRHSKILVQNETNNNNCYGIFIYFENQLWNDIEIHLTVAKT